MLALIIGGVVAAFTIRREFFPDTDSDVALINMSFPGATPLEVEESMARKIEDAIIDLDGVKQVNTTIREGGGSISVSFEDGVDIRKGIDDVDRTVNQLQDLPPDADRIQVLEFEPRLPVIMVSLFGDSDEETMKQAIRKIGDDLKTMPRMGSIVYLGVRDYELRVEISPSELVQHGVSLPRLADTISMWMRDVPSGSLRTSEGTINVRTLGVEERAESIRQIVVKATPDGDAIRVGDIADVNEGYVDTQMARRFNGQTSNNLVVFKTGDEDAVMIAEMVRAYVAGRNGESYPGSTLSGLFKRPSWRAWKTGHDAVAPVPGQIVTHSDLARFIEGRLDLLTRNAMQGGILVFIALLLVLNLRAAWWVMVGLFTAICGTLVLMTMLDVTLNLLTMFGLLVTLGMLTDDAIVVSENIMSRYEKGETPDLAAISGGNQVFWPVVATVTTTIVAFMPLMYVRGRIGDLLGALPMVVFCALAISLVECMLIMPSHMAHALRQYARSTPGRIMSAFDRFSTWRDQRIIRPFIQWYGRLVQRCIEYRYLTTSIALAILVLSVGMIAGGRVPFVFLPSDDSETIVIDIRMPIGTSIEQTNIVASKIEQAAVEQDETRFVSTTVGQSSDVDSGSLGASATHVAQIFVELVAIEDRNRESSRIIDSIRLGAGDLTDAEQVRFSEISGGPGGADITYEVRGEDQQQINAAVDAIKIELANYTGVFSITDDNWDSQRELQIELRPGAATLGFTVMDIARQVRGALFGLDAHVFSEKREDIDVRVRLSDSVRERIGNIENLWMISSTGTAVPLQEIASITEDSSFATLRRIDRKRAVSVTADAATGVNPEQVTASMTPFITKLQDEYPGIIIGSGGRQQDMADAFSSLPYAFIAAMLMIYVILAWLFSSYTQPFAVMLAIPFGVIGVVWGHFIMGYEITFLSLIGFVALAGVVVNNSLILVNFFNTQRESTGNMRQSLINAGMQRIRPILLTTATTVLGLSPLMLEQSFQARFLIPMAISISFGLISATALTLLVLPSLLVINEDLKDLLHYLWNGTRRLDGRQPGMRLDADQAV